LRITIELVDGWWDWTVEGDANARAPYCGTADTFFGAYEGIARTIQDKKRHPYNPKVRTEY
jgi:hypothetical protein